MKTAVATPAPRVRSMNLGQALIGQRIANRRPGFMLRADTILAAVVILVPQVWEMPR